MELFIEDIAVVGMGFSSFKRADVVVARVVEDIVDGSIVVLILV